TDYEDNVGWCPLAPEEVVYPSRLSIGFGGGDWSLFFSIGGAGCYYPTRRHVYECDPWPNSYCNDVRYVNNSVYIDNRSYGGFVPNRNRYFSDPGFVPYNARYDGAILASTAAFGGR